MKEPSKKKNPLKAKATESDAPLEQPKQHWVKTVLKNKLFILLGLFGIWILFFDSNNLMSLYHLKIEINKWEQQKVNYSEKIEDLRQAEEDLTTNLQSIVDYGREQLYIKKPNEDIFVVVPKAQEAQGRTVQRK